MVTPDGLWSRRYSLPFDFDIFEIIDRLKGSEAFLTGIDQSFGILCAAFTADQPSKITFELFIPPSIRK